ncbi:hypothetical protein CEXT_549151 [Caerostris extrusa]|uniref:Uncharacterized protein n=1 Tax=Caerostris extrusa TaxID=172846 RepID=A0AAV4Y466_CAEEX|nr:hypothetical protein CEXT_549151 [Caerostris extrusa]
MSRADDISFPVTVSCDSVFTPNGNDLFLNSHKNSGVPLTGMATRSFWESSLCTRENLAPQVLFFQLNTKPDVTCSRRRMSRADDTSFPVTVSGDSVFSPSGNDLFLTSHKNSGPVKFLSLGWQGDLLGNLRYASKKICVAYSVSI